LGQFSLTQQTENHGLSPWKENIKALADTAIMGNAMRKSLLVAFLTALMVCGFALTSTLHFGTVQASTEVTGVISLDTTWTKANSPYIFTGPVLVNSSVTLTIEPGVTVYLNGHYLRVNGTLSARGTSANKISLIFNGSHPGYPLIDFTSESVNWSETNQSGSIIENAVISITYDNPIPDDRSAVSIRNSSPKINNNTIITYGASGPRHKIIYSYGTPIISNNSIITNLPGSYVTGVYITTSSPVIFNNVITGGVWGIYSGGGTAVISNNTVTNCSVGIRGYRGEQVIFDNKIAANDIGIQLDSGGFEYEGSQTVEKNLIINNNIGVQIVSELPYDYAVPLIRNNTIIKNDIGVDISGDPNPLIMFNNIQGNNNYSVHLGLNWNERSSNINATYNWWGTTDIDAINQTIYDFKNDFNLGVVDFIPFLAEINPEAPVVPTFTISASAGANGVINPSGNVTVSFGANQTFNITPSTGYQITGLIVDGSSVPISSFYTFTGVQSDHSIFVSFAIRNFTISASAGANGVISPSGSLSVSYGGSQTFAISPVSGYNVADVLVDGASVGAVTSYTFTNITAEHTITATFEPAPTSTPTPSPSPSPTPSPTSSPTPTPDSSPSPTPTATPSTSPSPSPSLTPTPKPSELPLPKEVLLGIGGISAIVGVIIVLVILRKKK
jgi:hypothetical protein